MTVTAIFERVLWQALRLLASYGKLMAIGCGFDCEAFPEPKLDAKHEQKPNIPSSPPADGKDAHQKG